MESSIIIMNSRKVNDIIQSYIIETDCGGTNKLISKKSLWTREELLNELDLMTKFLLIYEKNRDDIEEYISWEIFNGKILDKRVC